MRRPFDEPSTIHISNGDGLGDYAFHEIVNSDAWFVDEAPDGRVRWESLPPSHPLSLAYLRRQQGMPVGPAIPPPIPVLKTPLLERSGVRATLLGLIGVSFIGLVAMSMRSTRAAEPPVAAAIAAPSVAPESTVPIAEPQPILPAPATAPKSLEQQLAALPAAPAKVATATPVKHTAAKRHKVAKRGKRHIAKRSVSWKWAD